MVGKKEKYLVAAQKFIERGQLDKALVEFTRVVQEDPKDTRTWLKMAELHAKLGANAEATEIYLRTGELYTEQGFAQKAVAVYKNVLKLSPGTVAAHLKLGGLFRQLGLMSDAVQQLDQAALALQRADRLTDAVAALRQAMEIQPDNVVLRVKLAESASQAGLTDEAVREFGKAADQLKAQGRTDESLRVVERLLFHQPTNFAKARELAEAYIAKGSPRLALPKLQACLNADERDPRTLSLLAKALEQLGQVEKAISVLKELVRLCEDLGRANERDAAVLRGLTLDPNDRELRAAAGRNQVRGDASGFDEATPPPVAKTPPPVTGGGTFDLSGVVRMPNGNSGGAAAGPGGGGGSGRVVAVVGAGESRSHGSRAGVSLDAGPDVNRILAEADVFVKYGLLERAVDHLGRVFEFEPESREARERLASVLQRLGRKQDAAHHLLLLAKQVARTSPAEGKELAERAMRLDPDSDEARSLSVSQPAVALDVGDDDPTNELATPPATTLSSSRPATAFDEGVHTEDFMIDLAMDDDPLGTPVGGAEDLVASASDDEQVTPPPMTPGVSPLVMARRDLFEDTAQDDDDPAAAFADIAATVAVSDEQMVAQTDEDDLSSELEQVDFFVDQALPEDARALLQDLEARFPHHPRVAGKLRELQLLDARLNAAAAPRNAPPPPVARRGLPSRTMIEGPSIEATPAPRAVVAGGATADFSTRADLAVAYKEMGLFDAAITELKLLVQDPEREVFALTTMGECFEAKGTFTEAVLRYKRALNCEQVTREETLALYYLLGGAFEHLGDISEALYFFEKVAKRDPSFRDAGQKVTELKPRMVKRAR